MDRKDKKDFKLYLDSLVCVDEMTNEEAGELLKAFIAFWREEEIKINGGVKFAYKIFEAQFLRDWKSYEETCDKNAGNGAKGGRPKKTQANPKNPVGFSETQKTQANPNKADTDTDTESETETETENKTKREGITLPGKFKITKSKILKPEDETILDLFLTVFSEKVKEIPPLKIDFIQNAFLGLSEEEKASLCSFLGKEQEGETRKLEKYGRDTEKTFRKSAEAFLAERFWKTVGEIPIPPPKEKIKLNIIDPKTREYTTKFI